jgi:uncharacterized protein YbjT (DUF2867 family)
MILITGSAGKTGQSVLQALVEKGAPVRALVHQPEQIHAVESRGAQDVVVGDMKSRETMERAVQDVRAVYHICPNVSPDEIAIGQIAIAAAQSAGVEHFVFHSVLNPQTEAMPHHWKKLRVEELLVESSLPYTILQPAAYMQNIIAHWERIQSEGIYPVPYPDDTRLSLVDLKDVAQAAAIVLTEPGHQYATYELVGIEGLSQTEVAAILSQELGRPVQATTVPLETWRSQAKEAGLGDYQIETLTSMFAYYQRSDLLGNPHALSWLLGRPPTTLNEFARRITEEKNMTSKTSLL